MSEDKTRWLPKLKRGCLIEVLSELECAAKSDNLLRQASATVLRSWLNGTPTDRTTIIRAARHVGVLMKIAPHWQL